VSTPEVGAVVVGAGIAGLAAALELQRSVSEVFVLDASDRPGGVMRTDHVSGYVVERGPNTFLVSEPMHAFLKREGVDGSLVPASPASRKRFVFHEGELVRVPLSPVGLAGTKLLSTRAKLRLLTEPVRWRRRGAPESVAEFAGRRLGREVVDNLLGPFLTGVYAGDENQLGAEAVLGSLVAAERRYGSLTLGLLLGALRQRGPRGLRGSTSTVGGLGPFARSLAELLVEPPGLSTRVTGIRRDGAGWQVLVSSPAGERRLRTARVVVAAPAPEAAQILHGVDPELAEGLEAIEYAPIVSIPIGVEPGGVRAPIEGFGFLVPRAAELGLLGCLFMSQLFPDRAPDGCELLQCMLGGAGWRGAVNLPDDVLVERLRGDLDRTLGLQADLEVLGVTRWQRAVPQPDRDHVARIAALRSLLASLPGLAIAGGYLDGVGVPATLVSGLRAAREVCDGAGPGGLGVE
jgi:oxygen-dependent protoporphyrinogen oxidase